MWLSCNGDVLATESASSSVANIFVAPTLQVILGYTLAGFWLKSALKQGNKKLANSSDKNWEKVLERFSIDCPKNQYQSHYSNQSEFLIVTCNFPKVREKLHA